MNAKKRYALVLTTIAFLAFCYYGGHRLKDKKSSRWKASLSRCSSFPAQSTIIGEHVNSAVILPALSLQIQSNPEPSPDFVSDSDGVQRRTFNRFARNCGMETCFNLTRYSNHPNTGHLTPDSIEYKTVSNSYNQEI